MDEHDVEEMILLTVASAKTLEDVAKQVGLCPACANVVMIKLLLNRALEGADDEEIEALLNTVLTCFNATQVSLEEFEAMAEVSGKLH